MRRLPANVKLSPIEATAWRKPTWYPLGAESSQRIESTQTYVLSSGEFEG
jgi:hypothetical protein